MIQPNAVPDYLLEQLSAGDLPGYKQLEVIEALRVEEGGMERLENLKRSNMKILEEYPPALMAAQISNRFELSKKTEPRRSKMWLVIPAFASAACAALIIWSFLPTDPVTNNGTDITAIDNPDYYGVKGPPQLMIYRKAGSKTEPIKDGQFVSEGDMLQLYYNAKSARHGMIFSVDGRGSVTLHFPSEKSLPTEFEHGGKHALDFSYKLDDAPVFEQFFLVWSDRPIPVESVLKDADSMNLKPHGELRLTDKQLKHNRITLLKNAKEK